MRKDASLNSTSAFSPSASETDIGVPFATGSVAGSKNEKSAAASETAAPATKIQDVESKSAMPKHFAPTSEKTPDATQPTVPKTRMRGKVRFVECASAIVAVSDQVGI